MLSSQAFEQYTLAFYNLENLFDYTRNKRILDADFTEDGRLQWTRSRYSKKLDRMARAIGKIGYNEIGRLPHIIGVAEVENNNVIEDLLRQPAFKGRDYGYVHYDSPDERGIDTALLYDRRYFKVERSEALHVYLEDDRGVKDTTRDILYVRGALAGFSINIYVNHWPSRRDGADCTNSKRVEVARQLLQKISTTAAQGQTVIMGDFNDEPEDESLQELCAAGFKNVTQSLKNLRRGTVSHKFKWYLFDQILISAGLENDNPDHLYFYKANIFDDITLRQWKGRYRGQPARTFVGNRYKGGYSDHFPVYMILRRN
ncbi:endonuclease/exonuclease/phosphatase [Nonlabens spongiae]|uniref:Endonuclease/exonuclease/phosphatase n=1 Tax=Nonlabens spongiae TaxID=331648 RepID=A0A1W6ML93_9FLAO|nr:endonuclease/exonuclease/phosphatase family protein [Nonlabens spongiae]ARN78365.1 endonuclease/exonuclease/phosphatase [Nonlabens spongiae]